MADVKGGVRCGLRRRCGQALVKTGISANEGGMTGFAMIAGNVGVVVYASSR
jgi:hypothetical protein